MAGYSRRMSYRVIDPPRIIETAERLASRIAERFPEAGLAKVAGEIADVARQSAAETQALTRPVWWLRISTAAVIAAGAALFGFVGTLVSVETGNRVDLGTVQGIEAIINTCVLAGVGIFTLVSLEERFKRKRAFRGLHVLRSLIHVVDMHQLTKDPVAYQKGFKPTASSPQRKMSKADLGRYLDYCSEMLSLTGKIAALYAQALNDPIVVDAVNDIESLATNLSQKIWQKITLARQS